MLLVGLGSFVSLAVGILRCPWHYLSYSWHVTLSDGLQRWRVGVVATCSVAELGADPEMRMVAGSGPLGVLDSLLTHFWRPGAGKATVVLKGRGGQFTPSSLFLTAPAPD